MFRIVSLVLSGSFFLAALAFPNSFNIYVLLVSLIVFFYTFMHERKPITISSLGRRYSHDEVAIRYGVDTTNIILLHVHAPMRNGQDFETYYRQVRQVLADKVWNQALAKGRRVEFTLICK